MPICIMNQNVHWFACERRLKQHHLRYRHPAEEADFKRGQRERIGLHGGNETLAAPIAAHRRNREVLEGDPQDVRQREIRGIGYSHPRPPRDRRADREQRARTPR